jgi:hypothetical protein
MLLGDNRCLDIAFDGAATYLMTHFKLPVLCSGEGKDDFERWLESMKGSGSDLFSVLYKLLSWTGENRSRVLLEKLIVSQPVKKLTPLPFMEPEGSLPCSEEPPTDPFPEPDQSNPHALLSYLIKIVSPLCENAARNITRIS